MHNSLITRYLVKTVQNYDLSSRNTFRMKVRCALYIEIEAEEELSSLDWDALPQPVLVLGGGSNLLFTGDFPGTVLHYGGKASAPDLCPGVVDQVHAVWLTAASRAQRMDQVQGNFGPGSIICAGPGPRSMASSGLQGTVAGPGPGGKIEPRPNSGWTRSNEDGLLITVPANTVFDDFCAWAAGEGLWGPENLSLIPGECGASAVQNIGAYGVEAKDIIASIRAWDRVEKRFVTIDPATCGYGYRASKFKTEWKGRFVITAVTYRLSKEPRPVLDYGGVRKALPERSEESLTPQLIRDTIIGIRRKKLPDPAEMGSAGSFFCNPVIRKEHFARIVATARAENGPDYAVPHYDTPDGVKVPAAWMIEQCGFKGQRLGGAQVYPLQPLVIVNESGEATPEEITGLEQQVIAAVQAKFGITLHPEVEHI